MSKQKKDEAEINRAGPYGPFKEELSKYDMPKRLYHALATTMEWMLNDMIHRAKDTELPTCQSDEMKEALDNYRDLCVLIGKDPTLLEEGIYDW